MCGIYGMVALGDAPVRAPHLSTRLSARLRHRGPDGHGERRTPHAVLGAARLRIQDLTASGDQPLADPASGTWLVCNGEIYNAGELRRRFAAYPFISRSDVEVVLPLYLAGGPTALADLRGMFALAIWDPRARTLVLARDRAGEKPLFRAAMGHELWFASDIAGLLEYPDLSHELDQQALTEYLALGFVRAPRTLLAAVGSVEPGCIEVHGCRGSQVHRYWDPATVAVAPWSAAAAEERGRELLAASVARQVQAEVPVGVFASGGLDSSLIATLAAPRVPEPLHLFTASFSARGYDESAYAAALARRLNARHVRVPVDEAGLTHAYGALTDSSAEPLADAAVLPTYLLARQARDSVGVVLSGEGADELFGGYPTYLGHALAPSFSALPRWLQRGARAALRLAPPSHGKVPLPWLLGLFAEAAHLAWPERHVIWVGSGLPRDIRAGAAAPLPELVPPALRRLAPLAGAMLFDYLGYLGSRLLPKLDRATMAVGLEARSPFLDPDVTAFGLSLPGGLKLRGLQAKWLLKRMAAPHLPRWLRHRRKRGLSVPVAAWLNGGFRSEVDRLLDPGWLRRQGLFSDVSVGRLIAEHRAGRSNHARALWTLVVLQRWLERWVPEVGS